MTRANVTNNESASVERLLSYREAGKILGVSERSVWTMVNLKVLPSVRFGRSVRIDPADLRRFIDRSKSGASARESE